jgi:UDP-N-acetylmuramoylalanine--D-glutamate ligase
MDQAVKRAYAYAKNNDIDHVILSPGAASFGLFLNEFDRGEQFNKCVNKLPN